MSNSNLPSLDEYLKEQYNDHTSTHKNYSNNDNNFNGHKICQNANVESQTIEKSSISDSISLSANNNNYFGSIAGTFIKSITGSLSGSRIGSALFNFSDEEKNKDKNSEEKTETKESKGNFHQISNAHSLNNFKSAIKEFPVDQQKFTNIKLDNKTDNLPNLSNPVVSDTLLIHNNNNLQDDQNQNLLTINFRSELNNFPSTNTSKDFYEDKEFLRQEKLETGVIRRLVKTSESKEKVSQSSSSKSLTKHQKTYIKMASQLTKQQMEDFKEAFSIFDKDGDGTISIDELQIVMSQLGHYLSSQELNRVIEQYDTDGDGTIDFEEFLNMMAKKLKDTDAEEEIEEAFKCLDRNGDGEITADEMKYYMMNYGEVMDEEEADLLIKFADRNGDGLIEFKEFCHLMLNDLPKELMNEYQNHM